MRREEIVQDIYTCASCGYCRFGCPVYHEVGFERVTVRGRMLLFKKLLEGKLDFTEDDQAVIESVFLCAQCENCKVVCPTGIDYVRISNFFKEDISEKGLMPEIPKMLRDSLLSESNPFGEPRGERGAWLPQPYREPRKSEHLYFVSCTASYSLNRIARSVLRILEMTDYDFTVLGAAENCCGGPLFRLGERERAKELVMRNAEEFDRLGVKTVFASCAGCFRTLSRVYPKEFKVYHIIQFFDDLIREGALTFAKAYEKKVIYFDGCDIGRHCGIYEEPRRVLRSIPGVELLEFDYNREEATCCGGPIMAHYPDIAHNVAAKAVLEAKEKGAEVIATSCGTCLLNFREGARTAGVQMEVVDIPMMLPSLMERKRRPA